MVLTTTAAGFIILSIGLAICGWWFLDALKGAGRKPENSKIGILLTCLFISSSVQNGVIGFGMLFFANSPEALYYALSAGNVFLIIFALLGVYTAYYIFSPGTSPKLGLLITGFLGILACVTTFLTHPLPRLTSENGIDLKMNFPLSVIVSYLLFISIGSMIYIFAKLAITATTRKVKNLALIIALLGVIGIVNIFIRFIVLYRAEDAVRTNIFDTGLVIIGITFIVALTLLPILRNLISSRKILL